MSQYQQKIFLDPTIYKISSLSDEIKYKDYYVEPTQAHMPWPLMASIAYLGGYGMGLFFGMFTNAVEMRDLEYGRSRYSTKQTIMMDLQKIKGTARGFAIFGFFFAAFEGQMEHLRTKDDRINHFFAGGLTSWLLSFGALGWKGQMGSFLFGGCFGALLYGVDLFGGH